MDNSSPITAERVHIVGIGGIGLSAIARILLSWGVQVSGSDLGLSNLTDELAALGARLHQGHAAENLGQATLVLVSSAVPEDNPEVLAARERGLPVLKRAHFLGEMMAGKTGIAIAGTHGKTTTTAMLAHVLTASGQDPTAIVGGIAENLGANARSGSGPHFVIEADEYDGMFLGLRPQVAVVTHLEWDHPDCYPDLGEMISAFERFLGLVPPGGQVVACTDEPHVKELLATATLQVGVQAIRYGTSSGADWRAGDIRRNERGGNDFCVLVNEKAYAQVSLALPGQHNAKNALGVAAVAASLGLEPEPVAAALATFRGVKRRFEIKGEAHGITVVDDYAHHPTEIRATLRAARERFGGRPLWAVFQPHTYSRTRALFDAYVSAFGDADHVLITDIYAAREKDSLGLHASSLAQAIAEQRGQHARYCASLDEAVAYLSERLGSGHVLITLGAGDGYRIGERILEAITSN